jgi:signal peptidase I
MTKHRPSVTKSPSLPVTAIGRNDQRHETAPPPDVISRHLPSPAAIRETIESVVIAFVLAFLFRTFEAEAFVIPTGSMAPTLMGRHKDVVCPKCGCLYQVNAHSEVDNDGNLLRDPGVQVATGTCPMCRYTAQLGSDNPQHQSYPSYNGDRILVSKFAYELADPQRWDVIVFKFPGDATTDARTNFIKRLAGLPGDTVRIQHGDLWIRRGQEPFQIARKPPEKLLAMLQPVFDNDYMPRIAESGWPARWQPEPAADGSTAGAWSSDDSATFHTDGTAVGENWLRYHHLVPDYQQWRASRQLEGHPPVDLTPQLIRDFTAYDTARSQRDERNDNSSLDIRSLGLYWVGDLALRCTAEVESEKGELLFELRKGGRRFQCRFDVATGQAALSISGQGVQQFHPTATTSVRGSGRHEIRFSNCDEELRLWVDGSVVQFDTSTAYDDLGNSLPEASDLVPVGVASVGAKARISHLAIFRDIYYIADDLSYPDSPRDATVRNRFERFADYPLKADQFFVLGDNSAWSKDGRLWGPDNYWVPRELLIGKALFIYWPHSWNKIPYVNIPFPMFPNFGRMGFVR